jgi:hypothetical protein
MWHLILACAFSLCSTDPLDRLERQASSLTFWQQSYDAPVGDSRLQDFLRLQRLAVSVLGVKLQAGVPDGIAGLTAFTEDGRVISLDPTLSPNAAYQVLAHEAGHVLQPTGLSKQEAEVFADAVSMLVTGDNVHVFSQYLAGSKSGLGVLRIYRKEIRWAATVLRGR